MPTSQSNRLVLPDDQTIEEHVYTCYAQNMGANILAGRIASGYRLDEQTAYRILIQQFRGIHQKLGRQDIEISAENLQCIWSAFSQILDESGRTVPYAEIATRRFEATRSLYWFTAKILYRLLTADFADFRTEPPNWVYDVAWANVANKILHGLPVAL